MHTYSGYENKVATNIEKAVENRKLQDLIGEVKVPTEMVTEIKDNKKREVERKIFPGYVLVKMIMTDDSWYVVRNIRGVTGFVGRQQARPPDGGRGAAAGRRAAQHRGQFCGGRFGPGERRLSRGFIGTVDEIDLQNALVRVTVSMMGKDVPVELEIDQIEPLN